VRGHPSATQLGFFVSSAANDRLFFHNVDNLRPSMQPLKGEHFYYITDSLSGDNMSHYTCYLTFIHQPKINAFFVFFA